MDTTQAKYDFLYDLYADCITIPDLIAIAQKGVYEGIERRVVCEQLIGTIEDDACHLSDKDVWGIYQLAQVRAFESLADEERDHWQKLKGLSKDELDERAERESEEFACPNCGGDMRSGDHNIQVAVDDFICRPDEMDYADYLYEARGDR